MVDIIRFLGVGRALKGLLDYIRHWNSDSEARRLEIQSAREKVRALSARADQAEVVVEQKKADVDRARIANAWDLIELVGKMGGINKGHLPSEKRIRAILDELLPLLEGGEVYSIEIGGPNHNDVVELAEAPEGTRPLDPKVLMDLLRDLANDASGGEEELDDQPHSLHEYERGDGEESE